jgi:hypothetical protein
MVVNKGTNPPDKKQDFVYVAILSAIAAGIGVYLIATTVLIAKDGISYINYAKGLDIDLFGVMRNSSGYAPRLYTPGYPFLILMTHKLVGLFGDGSTVSSWICSAQAAALLCRTLALIPLYFIGKEFVGGKLSFWAMLILVILPYPARFGSDVLRTWPHILFLATGFLFLIWGARYKRWPMFALAGIFAGFGYTVRPMCAQLVMYGVMWLTYSIFRQKRKCSISRAKLAGGLALLVIGFAVVAVPYMKIRGEILPDRLKQTIEYFSLNSEQNNIQQQESSMPINSVCMAGLSIRKDNVTKALTILISRISDHLMYYFMPALFIGMYYYFRRNPKNEAMFFITTFFLTNVSMVILRYCMNPDLSKRYVLPLVVFTIFFVPLGLQVISGWVEGMFSRRAGQNKASQKELQRRFFVLLIIGLAICIPKLFRPIRLEKKGYRLAAEWLKGNSAKEDVIVAPDKRISFYADRKGIEKLEKSAKYVVKKLKNGEESPAGMTKVWSSYLNNKKKKNKVVIYQRK